MHCSTLNKMTVEKQCVESTNVKIIKRQHVVDKRASTEPKKASAAQWHRERRQQILAKHPDIDKLPRYDGRTVVLSVIIPVLQLFMAIVCGYMASILVTVSAAAIVGAVLLFQMFNNGHELCHDTVHESARGGTAKGWLLHWLLLPDVNAMQWMYFRHGHISHHIHIGEQSQRRAWRLDLAQDADMLSHLSYLLAMKRVTERAAEHRFGSLRHPLMRYMMVGVLAPVGDTLATAVGAVPVALFHLWRRWRSALARRKLIAFLRHCAFLYIILGLLWTFAGVHSVVFLFLSRLFFGGWLGHPFLAYWITVHQSHSPTNAGGRCQPTTSIYDPLLAVLTMNEW